jgi:hypothetical protein
MMHGRMQIIRAFIVPDLLVTFAGLVVSEILIIKNT